MAKKLLYITANGEEFSVSDSTQITWDSNSNMNNFKTPGVYDIYGERTRQDDNLPILNASSGHSIAARLTVVASTLQPANNEICITQFLMLSNRKGGDGNIYVRTYNENNSPALDWWTPWQKLQGVKEGYIFTDTIQVNPDNGVQELPGITGLNNMIDNGIYTGIYTDDPSFTSPTFIDTFTLIVINNYAVAGKDERLKRTISQLKYAVDAITNQATVKQRTKTDGEDWSEWKDIAGGGNSEVDVTDALMNYSLKTLRSQGYVKQNTVYRVKMASLSAIPYLDTNNKIVEHILASRSETDSSFYELYIRYYNYAGPELYVIDAETSWGKVFKFTITDLGQSYEKVRVSVDMTEL